MSKSLVTGIDHSSVIVKDTARALSFYCGALGLALDETRPDIGYPGAWLKVGSQQIHLLELPNPDTGSDRPAHGGRDRHIALQVTDLSEIIDNLAQLGLDVSMSKSGRKAAFCRDFDANAIELIQK